MNKKNIYIKSIICALTFISCESHEQKIDDAFKIFKEKNTTLIDSTTIFKDSVIHLLKKMSSKKAIKMDGCLKYKNDLEAKVKANELAILKLKEKHNSNTKTYRKIVRLEDTNRLFLNQLKEYEEIVKKGRKDFEEKIDQELNDVNLSIKEYNDLK